MEFKNIDDLLKNTLDGYSKQPSPNVWRNISFRLFSKGAGIYFLGAVFMIILGSLYFLLLEKEVFQHNNGDQYSKDIVALSSLYSDSVINSNETLVRHENHTPEKNKENSTIVNYAEKVSKNQSSIAPNDGDVNLVPAQEMVGNELVSKKNHFNLYPKLIRFSEIGNMVKLITKEPFNPAYPFANFPGSIDKRNIYGKTGGKSPVDYARTDAFGVSFIVTPELVINENHTNNSTLNFDINVNYFKNDWFLQGGLGLGITGDDGIFDVQYAQYDSIGYYNKVSSFSVNPATGQLIYKTEIKGLYDTVEYSNTSTTRNYYSYLRVPFYAGINLRSYKRWSIDLKAGAIYSVLLNKNEHDFSYDNASATWININDETPGRIKSNIQLSTAVAFNFQVNQKLYLQVEPVYNYYVNSVYEKRFNIKSPYSLGLRIGLLLKF